MPGVYKPSKSTGAAYSDGAQPYYRDYYQPEQVLTPAAVGAAPFALNAGASASLQDMLIRAMTYRCQMSLGQIYDASLPLLHPSVTGEWLDLVIRGQDILFSYAGRLVQIPDYSLYDTIADKYYSELAQEYTQPIIQPIFLNQTAGNVQPSRFLPIFTAWADALIKSNGYNV